jgi:hypothetical protein
MRAIPSRVVAVMVLLLCAASGLAHQPARTVTYTGKPVRMKVRKSESLLISFPSAIRPFQVPVSERHIQFVKPTANYPNDLHVNVNDPPPSFTFTVPTASGRSYTIELIPVRLNPDTHVTLVDADVLQESARNPQVDTRVQTSFDRLVETSPQKEPMMALLYTQLGGHPSRAFPGVTMTAVNTLLWDDEVERREHIWNYQGRDGLGGYTYLITNKSTSGQTISLPKLGDQYANALYLTFINLGPKLDGDHFTLAPGASGLLHVITHANR